jgi:hypothetical protein
MPIILEEPIANIYLTDTTPFQNGQHKLREKEVYLIEISSFQ